MQFDTSYSSGLNLAAGDADMSFSRFDGGRSWNGVMDNAVLYLGVQSNSQVRAGFQAFLPDTYVGYFGCASVAALLDSSPIAQAESLSLPERRHSRRPRPQRRQLRVRLLAHRIHWLVLW